MKGLFFEKFNKATKPLVRFIKKKKKIQIPNIRNERQNITTDHIVIKRICYE